MAPNPISDRIGKSPEDVLQTVPANLPGASPLELLSQFHNLPAGADTSSEFLPASFGIGGTAPLSGGHETNINGEELPGGPGEAPTREIPVLTPQQLYDLGYRPA